MPSTPWTKPDTSTRPIAVIGGGVMGRRIAMMWIASGFTVILCEKAVDYGDAVTYVQEHEAEQAGKQGTEPAELKTTTSLQEAAQNAWMVIEAIPEKLEMKIELITELDKIAPPDCIIASNSSSLRTSQMIVNTEKNYRICNGHYYMPPEQTYFEVMSCGHTDPDIFPFLMERLPRLGSSLCMLRLILLGWFSIAFGRHLSGRFCSSWLRASVMPIPSMRCSRVGSRLPRVLA